MTKKKQSTPAPTSLDVANLAHWVANESVLFASDDSPFEAHVSDGDKRMVVITGENASGKSLFFRILCAKVKEAGPLPVTLSIRERAGGGLRQGMMFGEVHDQSTGATSVTALRTAFEHNLDRENGSVLGLDEPELGLSEAYSAALGAYIGQQTRQLPRACSGVVLVSHSRPLIRSAVEAFGATPTTVSLDGPVDLADWLERPVAHTVEDLLALREVGVERWRWALNAMRRND